MKTPTTLLLIAIASMSLAGPQGKHHPAPAVQKVTIVVDNGFKPANINVKAGHPVQITFDVKHRACASTVNFDSLHITKNLEDGKKTTMTFTPKKAGVVNYACGMNMLKGKITVK